MSNPFVSSFWTRAAAPTPAGAAEDRDAGGVTAAERTALGELRALLDGDRHALADSLSAGDGLGEALRNAGNGAVLDDALLRVLRYNTNSASRANAQLRATIAWRSRARTGSTPAQAMRGRVCGLPVALVPVLGRHRVTLAFAGARHYCRREVDAAKHADAAARFFDALFYAADGARAASAVAVVDFDALSFANVDLATTRADVALFLSHFPEAFARLLFVSYPRFVYHFYKLIAPLLDARTVERIVWCDSPQHATKELEKWFSRAQIPHWLGGEDRKTPLDLLIGTKEDDVEEKLAARFAPARGA